MQTEIEQNAADLEQELDWFAQVVDTRFKLYFGQDTDSAAVSEVTPPDLADSSSKYAAFLRQHTLSFEERVALVLALVPHVRPHLLDVFFTKNTTFDGRFTEFGGISSCDVAFVPTGETLLFILAGTDLEVRFGLMGMFDHSHLFAKHDVLRLIPTANGKPRLQSELQISQQCLGLFTTGQRLGADVDVDFPAELISTQLTWDDLVLNARTRHQVDEVLAWLKHGDTLLNDWGMAADLHVGYCSLFYGPRGTGKATTASLLGKSVDREVYRIDLSLAFSNPFSETRRHLDSLFSRAEHNNWILFVDEVDALFAERGEARSSFDRFANQEVSYLLQRVESFEGVIILSSHSETEIDSAFARRFASMVFFPMPSTEERLRIWQRSLADRVELADEINLQEIAQEFELSAASIMNVIRSASLRALSAGETTLKLNDLEQAIRSELAKVDPGN